MIIIVIKIIQIMVMVTFMKESVREKKLSADENEKMGRELNIVCFFR